MIKPENTIHSRIGRTAFILVFFLGIIAPVINKGAGKISAQLIILIGLFSIPFIYRKYNSLISTDSKTLGLICSSIYAYMIVNLIIYNSVIDNQGKLELYAYYLIPLLLAPLITLAEFNKHHLLAALTLTSSIAGGLAIYEYSTTYARVGFKIHGQPIPFGNLATISALLCFSLQGYYKSNLIRGMLIFAALAGLTASILSGTRGAWISLPFATIILVFTYRKFLLNPKVLSVTATILCLTAALVVQMDFHKKFNQRLQISIQNISKGDELKDNNTSIGIRLQLWKVALDGFLESPIIGKGITNYDKYKQTKIDDGIVSPMTSRFMHTHSEYMETLFSRGLIGITLLFFLFSWLFRYFFIRYREPKNRYLAASGLILTVCYAIFNLTDSCLSLHNTLSFFMLLSAILVGLLSQKQKNSDNTKVEPI